nr:nucleotide-binding alpha-beta plait domain-containing protein [Tanacetum cinerariifolium]
VEVEGVPCKWWSRNTFSRIASRWGTLLNGKELEEEGYHSNKICIRTKLKTVVFDSFKMVYRGMTCWVRDIEVPGWVPDFEELGEEGYDVNNGSHEDYMYGGVSKNLKDVECKSDREEVPETNFEEVPDKSFFEGNTVRQNDVHYEDLFGIYEGDVLVEKVDNWSDENRVNDRQENGVCVGHVHERVEVSNDTHESTCFGHFKKSKVPRKGGSILELVDDLVNELDGEVIIIGDFNEVRDISERREGSDADGHRRGEVVRLIQEVEKVDAMEVAQKAKIKWSVEGDENSMYYHGVLNKKRGRLTIRGVLVDGFWMESPHLVKHELRISF